MFGDIKRWFGVEGLKIRLHLAEAYPRYIDTLNGEIELLAKGKQRLERLELKLIERYSRGRGEAQRSSEHLLGTWELPQALQLADGETQRFLFKLPFAFEKSNIDRLAEGNILQQGLASLAKNLKGVQSDYRLELEAWVAGQSLSIKQEQKLFFMG